MLQAGALFDLESFHNKLRSGSISIAYLPSIVDLLKMMTTSSGWIKSSIASSVVP